MAKKTHHLNFTSPLLGFANLRVTYRHPEIRNFATRTRGSWLSGMFLKSSKTTDRRIIVFSTSKPKAYTRLSTIWRLRVRPPKYALSRTLAATAAPAISQSSYELRL